MDQCMSGKDAAGASDMHQEELHLPSGFWAMPDRD